ncbi:glycosyltransferase family 39 protein [Alphaproteobacteria bacterium]|nr:glycosyltransferase family 39 protein [Alphaproteobacteria bacterium]
MYIKGTFIFLSLSLLVKLIAIYLTNFDLFGDEAQYWIWSQSLDFGYYSKPPFVAWVISFFTFFLGNSFVIIKLIPIIFYIISGYVVYLLSLELFNNKNQAALTAASFYLMPAVSFSSFILSTDVFLIFFWSLSLLFFLKSITNPLKINFFILGIFVGISFLTKYAAVYFLISTLVLIFLDKKTRTVFIYKLTNLLIFIGSLLLVLLPNIIWNNNVGWITLLHTSENAGLDRTIINLYQGFEFIFSQTLMLSPILFVIFIFTIKKITFSFQTKFLLSFSIPIFLIVLLESVLVRANANWAAVALVSFFILMINQVFESLKKIIFINNIFNFVFCLVFYLLVASSSSLSFFDRINGISSFAKLIDEKHLKDIEKLVVEDRMLYSNLSYIFRNSKIKMYMPHNPKNKISNHFQMSDPLNENFEEDFLFIGNESQLGYLKKNKKIKKIDNISVLFNKMPINVYEVTF